MEVYFDLVPQLYRDFLQVLARGFTQFLDGKVGDQPASKSGGYQYQAAKQQNKPAFKGIEELDGNGPGSFLVMVEVCDAGSPWPLSDSIFPIRPNNDHCYRNPP